ncbi:beta-agarase [Candidatus Epulonipiscium viviparus]|uniref:beta-agarase n=1 Tax=Candidatus Epulonipiscium viviparus TaxID=420336 RepID=UPI00273806F1|nr:beta-agarase [Candidatus Epulopiscium viviparus]
MKLLKKCLFLSCALLFALPSSGGIQASEVVLPPEIQAEKSAFDTFPTLIEKYDTKIITQVNDKEQLVQSIAIPIEPFTLSRGQTKEIELPADIVRVMSSFHRIDVFGSGYKSTDFIKGISPSKGNQGKVSSPWFGDTNYQIRPSTFEIDHVAELARGDAAYTGYKFLFTGPLSVKSMRLFEQNGLSMKMDTTAWEVLGADLPVLDGITINVDATNRLSLEGITEFENDKFKRVYANPIAAPDGDKVAREYYVDKDFSPGRQIYKFAPALETGYSASDPKMTEDPNRPGYGTYDTFDEIFDSGAQSKIATFDALYGEDLQYVICFDEWPSWYVEGQNNGRGTPGVNNFDAAADLAAQYVSKYDEYLDGRGPTWIEVKNESSISNEWSHHNNPTPGYGWDVLADFHNKTALAIKELSPDTFVGGSAAAWMALDNQNFKEAENHMKFMDDTAHALDFYSYHFYESKDLILNDTATNYGGYLTGRLEADLDLLRNHMVNTNNIKPMVISETGTLHSGPTDPDYWIKLKNHNSYMIRYMNRANEFDMVVPFILPAMWWDKDAPEALWAYNKYGQLYTDAEFGLTPMKYFFEMWDEYNGSLLPVYTNDVNDNVFAHSAQDGNVIYIAINNMNPQQAKFDINLMLDDEQIDKIERTSMYLDLGKLHFIDNEPLDSLNDIFMHVEETSIIKVTLNESPNIDSTLTKTTYYGDSMLQDTGSPANFVIHTPNTNVDSSILRVSLGKMNGFNVPLQVSINNHNFAAHDMSYTNKPDRYFGYVDFIVPTAILQPQNNITVHVAQGGGKISTVALINLEK